MQPASSFVKLAVSSAKDHVTAGDNEKAKERFMDAFKMIDGALITPVVITTLLSHKLYEVIMDGLEETMGSIDTASLITLKEAVEAIDLDKDMKVGMAGEVCFGLAVWERYNKESTFLKSGLLELDKAIYLDRMIDLAVDPTVQTAQSIREGSYPIYTSLTPTVFPLMKRAVENHEATKVKYENFLAALKREIVKR